MTTSIIGLGSIGSRLATNLVAGKVPVLVADRDIEKAKALAQTLGPLAMPTSIPDAIGRADIVVFGVWFDTIKELLAQYRSELAGKILVDPSNPIVPDGKGGFKKTIAEDQSSGQLLAALLPPRARLVKAFGSLGAETLSAAANRSPERAVEFYANDDLEAGNTVADLIRANGFDPVRVGGIDQSIRIEVFGDLHEYGKLGRTVTAREAQALI